MTDLIPYLLFVVGALILYGAATRKHWLWGVAVILFIALILSLYVTDLATSITFMIICLGGLILALIIGWIYSNFNHKE